MKNILAFLGDTVKLLYIVLTAMLSLTINTVIFILSRTIGFISGAVTMYSAVGGIYLQRAKALLSEPVTPSDQPKRTLH